MKFNIVQIIQDAVVSHLIHDPIRLLLYTLEDLGHDVVVNKDIFMKDRINIVVIGTRLSEVAIDTLIKHKVPYVIYQTEVFSDKGLNYQPIINIEQTLEWQRVYLKFLRGALMIWECFDFNQEYLQKIGIESHLIYHGYHRLLEGQPKKQDLDIDVVFFGTRTPYREQVLKTIKQRGISLMVLQHDGPLFRDEVLRRAKINLSIRANDETMSHLPHFRVFTGLYHNTMTVSEHAKGQDWMVGLVNLVPPQEVATRLQELLKSKEYIPLAQQYRQAFLARPMEEYMKDLVAELKVRLS